MRNLRDLTQQQRNNDMIINGPDIFGAANKCGPIPLLSRDQNGPNTSILIRGKSGCGKTILGAHIALMLAMDRKKDAAIGTIEALPVELVEQQLHAHSPRPLVNFIVDWKNDKKSEDGTNVWMAMLDGRSLLDGEIAALVGRSNAESNVGIGAIMIDTIGKHEDNERSLADDTVRAFGSYGISLIVISEFLEDNSWVPMVDIIIDLSRCRWSHSSFQANVVKNRYGEVGSAYFKIEDGKLCFR